LDWLDCIHCAKSRFQMDKVFGLVGLYPLCRLYIPNGQDGWTGWLVSMVPNPEFLSVLRSSAVRPGAGL
jgi:hypothetical protein